jgi:predicted metalloprotease
MRWRGREQSSNVEDRRGMSAKRVGGIGGVGAIVVALIAIYFGQDPSSVLQGLGQGAPGESSGPYQESAQEAEMREMIGVVLKDTEMTWTRIFAQAGRQYAEPTLVLFKDAVDSACGSASSAMGPFYCSGDSRVFLDLSFFSELHSRFGAPGDFAQAYVIAHEVGHHVQNLLGTSRKVHDARRQMNAADGNAMSVRLELQADCYAGVWANHANESRQLLETGDLEEGLTAAAAVGDDRLQKQSQGRVMPESFTHGTSEQRMRWFKRGFRTGDASTCDTFAERSAENL